MCIRDRVCLEVGAAAAIGVKAVSSFLSANDAIGKMSTATGISTTTLQEWGFAAEQSGTDIGTVEKGVQRFSRVINDASNGSETATRSLTALGLSAEELGRLTPEQQMLALADAIAGVEDPTQRTALAQEVLGRSGATLIPLLEGGSDGFAELGMQAHEAGRVLDEDAIRASERTNDAMNIFNSSLKGVVNQGIAALLPAIEGLATFLSETVAPFMTNTLIPVMQRLIKDGFKAVKDIVEDLQPVFKVVWEAIKFIVENNIQKVKDIVQGGVNVFKGVITFFKGIFTLNFKQAWEGIRQIFAGVLQQLLGHIRPFLNALGKIPFVGGKVKGAVEAMDRAIENLNPDVKAAEDAVDDMTADVTAAVKPLNDMQFALGVTGGKAVDAANDIDEVTSSLVGFQSVSDQLSSANARAELFALAAAEQVAAATARGDDPFIAAQESLDALSAAAGTVNRLTGVTSLAADLKSAFVNSNVGGDRTAESTLTTGDRPGGDTTDDEETTETGSRIDTGDTGLSFADFNRLLEEQRISLLREGFAPAHIERLLQLYENDLLRTPGQLRGDRIARGGFTAFESSLNTLRDAYNQPLVETTPPIEEETETPPTAEEETEVMAKAVAKGIEMVEVRRMQRHVCPPPVIDGSDAVLNAAATGQRGTQTRNSGVLDEGYC